MDKKCSRFAYNKKTGLNPVEKIVHRFQIFFVGSVEPIWGNSLRMPLGRLSDFPFRISFV